MSTGERIQARMSGRCRVVDGQDAPSARDPPLDVGGSTQREVLDVGEHGTRPARRMAFAVETKVNEGRSLAPADASAKRASSRRACTRCEQHVRAPSRPRHGLDPAAEGAVTRDSSRQACRRAPARARRTRHRRGSVHRLATESSPTSCPSPACDRPDSSHLDSRCCATLDSRD